VLLRVGCVDLADLARFVDFCCSFFFFCVIGCYEQSINATNWSGVDHQNSNNQMKYDIYFYVIKVIMCSYFSPTDPVVKNVVLYFACRNDVFSRSVEYFLSIHPFSSA